MQVGLDGPLGIMRQHELRDYAQRLPVCHDYLRHGRSFWLDGWWQLACALHLENPPEIRIEDRVARNRFYVFLQRTWMAQQLPLALLFYSWGGWGFVFWGVCARVAVGVGGHWLIGYFAHNHGDRHFDVRGAAVQGHNVHWTSLLTMGECWHNNHHAFPGSAKLGLRPGEWDPGWWTLVALKRCGLVWDLRLPEDLAPRPELVELPDAPRAPGLAATVKLAFASDPLTMRWPAATLSPRQVQRVLGNSVALELHPEMKRLTVFSEHGQVRGLPGLCVALARRHFVARVFASVALPLAIFFERLRASLERAQPA
jgi:fatty acid desaturase